MLHNMIIKSKQDDPVDDSVDHQVPVTWAAFLTRRREIRDAGTHLALQNDLVQHLWARKGNGNDNTDADADANADVDA